MGLLRVTFAGTYFSQLIENVVHFYDETDAMALADVATELKTYWLQPINTQQSSLMVWRSITVVECPPAAHVPYTLNFTLAIGPSQSDGYPSVLSVVWSFRTAWPGRAGRGRIYIPALLNGAIYLNVVNAAYLANWQGIADGRMGYYGPSGSSNLRLVVAARNAPAGETGRQVTNIIAQAKIGVQRRRNQGVGM